MGHQTKKYFGSNAKKGIVSVKKTETAATFLSESATSSGFTSKVIVLLLTVKVVWVFKDGCK